jgi:hypothetical protein
MQVLTLPDDYNGPITPAMLHNNVYRLVCGRSYNLVAGALPLGLRELIVGADYNQQITADMFPDLTHLTFGDAFNLLVGPGVLPQSLTHLTFGRHFNQPIAMGVLPVGLTHLALGRDFNQPIAMGVLPAGLTHLTLGRDFNQPIAIGALPESVTLTHIW